MYKPLNMQKGEIEENNKSELFILELIKVSQAAPVQFVSSEDKNHPNFVLFDALSPVTQLNFKNQRKITPWVYCPTCRL